MHELTPVQLFTSIIMPRSELLENIRTQAGEAECVEDSHSPKCINKAFTKHMFESLKYMFTNTETVKQLIRDVLREYAGTNEFQNLLGAYLRQNIFEILNTNASQYDGSDHREAFINKTVKEWLYERVNRL